jgi:4-hydroxy-3-methylbut-2-enyl diphosphate reductase
MEKKYVVVVYPDFPISTKEAYSEIDYAKAGRAKSSEKFIKDYDLNQIHNDFEFSILKKYPQIVKIKKELGKNSLLSGSGSCVFGLYGSEGEAKEIYARLKNRYKDVFLTATLNKKIVLAKEYGFCFGVKRAIDEIHKIGRTEDIYILGNLINNPSVVRDIEEKGFKIVQRHDNIKKGIIVITAHGIADDMIKDIRKKGLKVIDLTCPLVKKVHNITKKEEKAGRKILIFGDKGHTEVKGIMGNLKKYKIFTDIASIDKDDLECSALVSQTTRSVEGFKKVSDQIKKIGKDVKVIDTICAATKNRQKSAIILAKKSDIMIIVGGKISSNTLRLKEVCKEFCMTEHIETGVDLNPEWFYDKRVIGITAGASTPENIISDVIKKIEMMI